MMTYPLTVYSKDPDVSPDEFDAVEFHAWNREFGFFEVRTPDRTVLYNLDVVGLVELSDRAAFITAREAARGTEAA